MSSSAGNSSDPAPVDPNAGLVSGLEDFTGGCFCVLLAMMVYALFGKHHSRVPWVRRYFIVVGLSSALRAIKLLTPAFALYRPFQGQPAPELGSKDWWMMFAEWLLYVSGSSLNVIAYAIILRLWHSALEIVVGSLPSWPQLTLLYLVTLSLATNLVLTVLLVFMAPDTVNVVEALKDCIEALVLAAAFISYWYLLQRALRQFAALTKGRTIYVSGREIAIGEKALRKLKRIMWVSALCTLGSMYRAASLTNFVLIVLHLAQESYGEAIVVVERFLFYLITEVVPPVSMFLVMMKFNRSNGGNGGGNINSAGNGGGNNQRMNAGAGSLPSAKGAGLGGGGGGGSGRSSVASGFGSPPGFPGNHSGGGGGGPGSVGSRGSRAASAGVGGATGAGRGRYHPVGPDNNRFLVN